MQIVASHRVQELEDQFADLLGLLLLHPMPGALDQMCAQHAGARHLLHGLECTGSLIDAPVAFPADEK